MSPPAVTAADIYRYRYQHGVNLGGVFVLERWLFSSMFDSNCKGESELDAVTTYGRSYYPTVLVR